MYDHRTESLWSQILSKAVTGPMTGTPLRTFPLVETSWKDWKSHHPDTLVLSIKTGYTRPYHQDPYGQSRLAVRGKSRARSRARDLRSLARQEEEVDA